MPASVLIVEDDLATADYVRDELVAAGYQVTHAVNGENGLASLSEQQFDVLIVDRMLPGVDGLTLVRTIRDQGNRTPVLFLTTMSGIDDRVEGLDAGGDDYLTKPFALNELLARIKALLRRAIQNNPDTILQLGGVEMRLLDRTVTRDGTAVDLGPTEFRLLEFIMRNAGNIVTRKMLLEEIWNFHFDPNTNIVETHISRLRGKLNAGGKSDLIETVRGTGYIIHEKP